MSRPAYGGVQILDHLKQDGMITKLPLPNEYSIKISLTLIYFNILTLRLSRQDKLRSQNMNFLFY